MNASLAWIIRVIAEIGVGGFALIALVLWATWNIVVAG